MRCFCVFLLFAVAAFAGFCENKFTDGWYCDGFTAKYCEDQDKDREQHCGFRCVQGYGCVRPCQLKKAPPVAELPNCLGIVTYSVDDSVNVASEDQQAQTQAASYPPANGTSRGINCAAAYKNFACRYQLVNCDDRTRLQCFVQCNHTNICRSIADDAPPLDCSKMCSGVLLKPILWVLLVVIFIV